MDAEHTPQDQSGRVIRTPEDLAEALTATFLRNAERGENAANDELIQQMGIWRRRQG
jgi:flagellar biosynthesis chaperone FliJ